MADIEKVLEYIKKNQLSDIEGEGVIIQRKSYAHIVKTYSVNQGAFEGDLKKLLTLPQGEAIDFFEKKIRPLIDTIPKIIIKRKNDKAYFCINEIKPDKPKS